MYKLKEVLAIIMAVSLMLLASCGKTKELIDPGLNRGDVIGSEGSGNSRFSHPYSAGKNNPVVNDIRWCLGYGGGGNTNTET